MQSGMSKRIAVTVPDKVYTLLEMWAKDEGRPLASLCNYLLEKEAKEHFEQKITTEREGKNAE